MQSETWPLGFDQRLAELCVSLCAIKVGVGSDSNQLIIIYNSEYLNDKDSCIVYVIDPLSTKMKISSKRSNPFSHPWKISPSKKKKLISRLWKSRPRTNFRISFLGEDSKPQSRAAESAQLSRAFLFLCTFPSLPTRASLRSPTRASEAPFLRRVVRS